MAPEENLKELHACAVQENTRLRKSSISTSEHEGDTSPVEEASEEYESEQDTSSSEEEQAGGEKKIIKKEISKIKAKIYEFQIKINPILENNLKLLNRSINKVSEELNHAKEELTVKVNNALKMMNNITQKVDKLESQVKNVRYDVQCVEEISNICEATSPLNTYNVPDPWYSASVPREDTLDSLVPTNQHNIDEYVQVPKNMQVLTVAPKPQLLLQWSQ